MTKRLGALAIAVLVVALILARLPLPTPERPTPSRPAPSGPLTDNRTPRAGTIPWEQASQHRGENRTVCGPVVSTAYGANVNGAPTWLNIGRDHPDTRRFQVLIWGDDRSNFPQPPEEIYQEERICATGVIEIYEGVAEMVIASPASIVVQ